MTGCPGCGFPLGDDESICPACGLSVGGPTPVEGAGPAPEEPGEEAVLPSAPADEGPGRLCPECGTLNPEEARFCIRCRHSFAGGATFFGLSWVVVPAVLGVFLIVAVAAAFSMGAFGGPDEATGSGSAATAGAEALATQAVTISRNATLQNGTAASTGGANNTTVLASRTLNATPTRTVDPNATPWNAKEGSGIYHTEGGTHHVDASPELRLLRKAAAATPTPVAYGLGDGSGHATGPLSWVGTGNWTPGFIDLPGGDAQVVLLSKGTTAFVLVDEAGTRAGYGVFSPPGGTYTVPIPQAGRYVIAFGTANRTDSWSATVLLPGTAGGQAAAPPVPTPKMQLLSFSGTGGGTPGTFNLTPGTVHVQLYADEMTMAYLKDPWGVTLSTTVAGPNAGGSTVAVTQSGRYRLDVWGTGAWSATATWTGTPETGGPTLPTVDPAQVKPTLTPWNATAAPVTAVTTAPVVATPPATIVMTVTTVPASPLTWSGNGSQVTPFFNLQSGVYKIFAETDSGVIITMRDSQGKVASVYLPVVKSGSEIFRVENTGSYVLDIQGDEYPWKIGITPVSTTSTPTGGDVVLTGNGYTGLGPFYLNQGYNTMVISSDTWVSTELLDDQGYMTDMTIHYSGTGTSTHAFNVPSAGSYFLNVHTMSNQDTWTVTIKPGQ